MLNTIQQKINEDINIEILISLSIENLGKLRELLTQNPKLYDLKNNDGFNLLHYACIHGLIKAVQLCIDLGFNINIRTTKNNHAIHILCQYGNSPEHLEIMKLLINKNKTIFKEIDAEGHTPLFIAHFHKHGHLVRDLLVCLGERPLHTAVSESMVDIIPVILEILPDSIDIPNPNVKNNTALNIAIIKGNIPILTHLVNHGASITVKHEDGRDAIDLAIQKGIDIVKILLQGKVCREFVEIKAEDDNNLIQYKLITSLLYIAKRHSWDSLKCLIIRRILVGYNCPFECTIQTFESYIRPIETSNQTFYGSYLSDDSDSDEESKFNHKSEIDRVLVNHFASQDCIRAESNRLSSRIGNQEKFEASKVFTTLKSYRQAIPYITSDPFYLHAYNELTWLNNNIYQYGNIRRYSENLSSLFFISQYRGITYLTTKWNQTARRKHRKLDETGKAQYSASVLFEVTGKTNFAEILDDENYLKNEKNLKKVALVLQEMLANLKNTPKCRYNGFTYDNLYELLQCAYTGNYDNFHYLIKNNSLLKNYLLNNHNPLVSTGNVPYHALKYAYGIKPYKGHENERLRPRWRKDGKAERPYSGKVYVSLHPITDYEDQVNMDVIDLIWSGKIEVPMPNIILPERETSFAAYICEDRIVIQHVAKYPSFHKPYKNIFLSKYGMTQQLYQQFQIEFRLCYPHQERMTHFKEILGEWLCAFHEVHLIRLAKYLAEHKAALLNKKGFLIYRNLNGRFSFDLPTDAPSRNGVEQEEKEYPNLAKNYRKFTTVNPQQIEFITNQFCTSAIDIMQQQLRNGIQHNSLNEFYQAVISGNVRNIERLFYPLEYLHIQFPIQNEILATTVLHYSVTLGFVEVVKFLIAKGAPINARDANGDTPLHLAVRGGHVLIAKILICKGAFVKIVNKLESPIDIAQSKNMHELVNLMLLGDERYLPNTNVQNIPQLPAVLNQNSNLKTSMENTQKQLSEKEVELQKLKLRVAELEAMLESQQKAQTQYVSDVQSLATKLLTLGRPNGEKNNSESKYDNKKIASLSLNEIYQTLTDTGKLAQITPNIQDIKATDFGIEQALNFYFSQAAHILQPNLSSVSSPFDDDPLKLNEALKNYGERIAGYIDQEGIRQKNSFIDEDGGVLKKPIIMIINTSSATAKFKQDVNATGGTHWVTCVILPKKYSINGKYFEHVKERIFYIDSFYQNMKLPQNFKDMLTKGFEYNGIRQPSEKENPLVKDVPYKHTISPAFADPEFIDLESIPQQMGGEDCGWWSFYNAFMIVMTGESSYVKQFKERSREFAYKLRAMLPSLLNEEPLVKIKENINIPPVQQLIDNSIFSPKIKPPITIAQSRVETSKIEQRI